MNSDSQETSLPIDTPGNTSGEKTTPLDVQRNLDQQHGANGGLQPVPSSNDPDLISPEELKAIFDDLRGLEILRDPQGNPRQLGRGSFGEVLLARERQLRRQVAVKALRQDLIDSKSIVMQFLEEGRLTSQLQHPGIPSVHAIGLWEGRPAIVMKLIEGQTLHKLLKARDFSITSNQTELVDYFLQICRAVGYAHSVGRTHLDLKPSNVMIGAHGEVQVMDWGLAERMPDAGTEDGSSHWNQNEGDLSPLQGKAKGTYPYMPPEQANGRASEYGPASDVFSLGAILSEMLTGRPAYSGTKSELRRKATQADLTACIENLNQRELQDGTLAPLAALARWCLAADPKARPSDAGRVAEAISCYQEDLRQQVLRDMKERVEREQQKLVELARRRLRNTIAAVAGAGLFIAAVMGTGVSASISARNSDTAATLKRIDEALKRPETYRVAQREFDTIRERNNEWSTLFSRRIREDWKAAERDLAFIAAHEKARKTNFESALVPGSSAEPSDFGYGTMFRDYGITPEDKSDAITKLKSSRIRKELLAGLDHWSCLASEFLKPLLREIGMQVSEIEWRQQLRNPRRWTSSESIKEWLHELRDHFIEFTAVEFESLARILKEKQMLAEMEEVLRRGTREYPDDLWLNLILGQTLSRKAISEPPSQTRRDLLQEAVSYLRAAAAVSDDAFIHVELSRALLELGNFADAELEISRVRKAAPDSIPALRQLAEIELRQGKFDEAHSVCSDALNIVKNRQLDTTSPAWIADLKQLQERINSTRTNASR